MKKLLFIVLVLILAFSTIGASLASVNALKAGETTSFWSGRAGITFVDSRFSGTVTVTRKSNSSVEAVNEPEFVQRHLDVRLTDSKQNKVKFVIGPVYVYYKVTDRELRAFETEGLRIWYFDSWKNEWTPCDTVQVGNGANGNELSCRIRVFGLYGLGK
jgi:hypothetical protein